MSDKKNIQEVKKHVEIIEILDSDDKSNDKDKEQNDTQKLLQLNIMSKQDFYTIGNCYQCFQMGPINSFCSACRVLANCVFQENQCISDKNPMYILFKTT